jgi:hypothetical protein
MIIKKELVVSNRKKAAIVDELRTLKFRPFPKVKVARAAGEDEETLEEADEGLASDYDYLLGMAIWSLTEEKVRLVFFASFEFYLLQLAYERVAVCLGQHPPPRSGREGGRAQRAAPAHAERSLEYRS